MINTIMFGVYVLLHGVEILYYNVRSIFISSDASSLLLDNYESDSDMLEDQSELD